MSLVHALHRRPHCLGHQQQHHGSLLRDEPDCEFLFHRFQRPHERGWSSGRCHDVIAPFCRGQGNRGTAVGGAGAELAGADQASQHGQLTGVEEARDVVYLSAFRRPGS